MLIPCNNINLNVELFSEFDENKKTIFLLHGFTGSSMDWENFSALFNNRFNIIAIDLIGHGKSDSPKEVNFYKADSINKQIWEIVNHFRNEKIILLGYSMGGRAALNFAVNHPGKISVLILESTSAGIKNEDERKARLKSDEQLADFIETHTMVEFVNKWMGMEIFSTLNDLPEEKIEKLNISKTQNSKIGLANSLRGFGTGIMPFLGNKLSTLNFPVLLISGELDSKFTQINNEIIYKFPDAEHKVITNSGHNIHFEQTENFVKVVSHYLNQF
jgi:2-succinyl-6-hydroxy-2,4-cyclohexadiene-1-carboxylate synthase